MRIRSSEHSLLPNVAISVEQKSHLLSKLLAFNCSFGKNFDDSLNSMKYIQLDWHKWKVTLVEISYTAAIIH